MKVDSAGKEEAEMGLGCSLCELLFSFKILWMVVIVLVDGIASLLHTPHQRYVEVLPAADAVTGILTGKEVFTKEITFR